MRFVVVLAVLLLGCGARTSLSIGDDAGTAPPRPDAALRDAAPRDAAPRDAGVDAGRDAGPPRVGCEADSDCRTGVCRASADDAPRDLEALRLFCGSPEADPSGAPGAPCRERVTCDRHLCAVSGACLIPCRNDADCASSELCRQAWVQTSPGSMESFSACTARVAAPSTVDVSAPEAGPRLTDTAASDLLDDLRPNALVVWRGPADSEPVVERVVSRLPGNELVFDAFEFRDIDAPAPDWGIGITTIREVTTLMHPNGPRSPSSRRGFEVFLSSTVRGPSERLIFQRDRDGSSFDIDLYLVGGNGWSAPDGVLPRQLAGAIEDLRELFAPLGIELGDVRAHDVVGGQRRRFEMLTGEEGLIGVPPDLPHLYRLSAGANRPSVHVFLVRFIEGALGIASGIPGPHAMPGTGASGVAIAADMIPIRELARVMAHEIGHFAGLFHTSELDGSTGEPLTDTRECRADRDVDGDGFLVPDECVGAGAENLMFWAGGVQVSDQQAELMRRAYYVE